MLHIILLCKPVGTDSWKHVKDDFNTVAAQTPGFKGVKTLVGSKISFRWI